MGKYDELVRRLNERLGGVETPMMQGDNLAVMLCSFFDNPDQEPGCDDDCGWTADALDGYNEVLEAIRAHYAPLATAITTLEAELAAAQHQVKGALVMYDALVVKLEAKEAELAAMKARGDRLAEALEECLREHGGYMIKGRCEHNARQALTEWRDQ